MNGWVRDNRTRCSYVWYCPFCKEKVYYISGTNAKNLKNKEAECIYKFCPHCRRRVIKDDWRAMVEEELK